MLSKALYSYARVICEKLIIAVYIDSLVMISIEWSEKTQKNALDVRENDDVIIIRSMT